MERKDGDEKRTLIYEGDRYGKGKDEERKEKIIEWLRRRRRGERNKKSIRGRVKIFGRLKREEKRERKTRVRRGKEIGEGGNED